jgi:hypothetical protein
MNETSFLLSEANVQVKILVPLSREAALALQALAIQERREPKQQAGWLIERELERRGLIKIDPTNIQNPSTQEPAR